jgi:phosphate transport system protein
VLKIFEKEMRRLEREMLTLSALVEESVMLSIQAVRERNGGLAEQVLARDREIDEREVQLEEECLKILALHQPVASDLRILVAVLKINNDLERVGDLAVTIGRCALRLGALPPVTLPPELRDLAAGAVELFGRCLDCFTRVDVAAAREVRDGDRTVDDLCERICRGIHELVRTNPEQAEQAMNLFRIARSLERIGDHAKNIAEDVIYMMEGGIVRHRH